MRWHQIFRTALIVLSPAITTPRPGIFEDVDRLTPLHVNIFPNKRTPSISNNMLRITPFCYFASFSIVLLTLFINISESSRELNSFHDIINFFICDYQCNHA